MKHNNKGELVLGLAFLAFALFVLLIWVPLDTDTGLIEKVRRRWVIGDALAPSVAAVLIALGGGLVTINALLGRGEPMPLGWSSLRFAGLSFGLLFVAFLLMRWIGPLAVTLAGEAESYRNLRDTLPWKYLGFLSGGFVLIFVSIVAVERRLTVRAFLVAVLAPLIIALVYDLPFDDLLLPPNGDL